MELSAFPGTRGLRRRQCRLVTTDAPSDALASRDLGGAVAVELWGRPSWDGLLGIFMANYIYKYIYIYGCKSNYKVRNKVRDHTRSIPPFHTSVPYLFEGSVPYLCSIPLIHTLLCMYIYTHTYNYTYNYMCK